MGDVWACRWPVISIHALLAESDHTFASLFCGFSDFYPRSPCGERRAMAATITPTYEFLSTLSLRRATLCSLLFFILKIYFYPRSPCGERLFNTCCAEPIHVFLSTLSLRRATELGGYIRDVLKLFLSTLSLRRATSYSRRILPYLRYFYPRSPCGERPRKLPPLRAAPAISIHALLAESDSAATCKK